MRDGKPDGYWRTYYVTGVIKSEGKRTNFLLDSIWNFYNQAGELTQQINYKLGEKSGYSIRYSYDNPSNPGQPTVISRELYVNGKKGRKFILLLSHRGIKAHWYIIKMEKNRDCQGSFQKTVR